MISFWVANYRTESLKRIKIKKKMERETMGERRRNFV